MFVADDVCDDVSGQHGCAGSFRQCRFGAAPWPSGEVHVDIVNQLSGVRRQLSPRVLRVLAPSAAPQPPPTEHGPSSHGFVAVQ